jgi:hypothetical protein
MSGQKKLNRVTKNIRVVAMPSKKRKDYAYDENGQIMRDPKTNEPIMKEVQLYKIKKMR